MKRCLYFLISFSSFFFTKFSAYSQAPCYANCQNLTNTLFSDTKKDGPISFGKANAVDYYDVEYYVNATLNDCGIDVDTDQDDVDCRTDANDLLIYYVYYPDQLPSAYNQCPLPAVVLWHGSGFSDCATISSAFNIDQQCQDFAKRGFVAFNVEYRRGTLAEPNNSIYYTAQKMLAFYRGFQDGRGALRSIIKKQRNKTSNDPYQIDTNFIFVGGASAGSNIAINLAYYPTQSMNDQIAPDAKARMGSLDQDFYYGEPDIDYFSKIKGIMDMWGNGFLPVGSQNDPISFFSSNSHFPPMIAFHGLLDMTAPINSQEVFFSPNQGTHVPFHSESNCLTNGGTYTIPSGAASSVDLYSGGAQYFYDVFHNIVPMELYIDCQMAHGLDDNCSGTNCYQTEYGTGLPNKQAVNTYMVVRAATFFQAIIKNKVNLLGKDQFVECENDRHGCSTDDDHETCPADCTQE